MNVRQAAPSATSAPAPASDNRFLRRLVGTVVLAAIVRLAYMTVAADHVSGDGLYFHFQGNRLANGLGYTAPFFGSGAPTAIHPPGWVTVLGAVSRVGATSIRWHQLVGVIIGLGVVALAGLVGRRYFNPSVGILAAVVAAVYPGFWVLETQILAEPLALFLLGLLMLAVADLHDRPTWVLATGAGVLCGLLALTRSEGAAMLVVVIAPTILMTRRATTAERVKRLCLATVAFAVVIMPWAVYNSVRLKGPVLLSTEAGGVLLGGNCPEAYEGPYMAYQTITCDVRVEQAHPGLTEAQLDGHLRRAAIENMTDNLDRLPVVVTARFGRTLGLFRPGQTVDLMSRWLGANAWPVWLWVVSFWFLLPLSAIGVVAARRMHAFLLPLLGPVAIVCLAVFVVSGEPRFHTFADLSLVVLAAAGIQSVWRHGQLIERSHRS